MCHHSVYRCGQHSVHTPGPGRHHYSACCCGSGNALQPPASREEVARQLEDYLGQLRAEVRGVEERIAELKKEG